MKSKTKKIMALIMLSLILLTSLPIKTFATFITDINSNAEFGIIPGSLENYGHQLHYANYSGTTYLLFCTQFGEPSASGNEYVYNGDFLVHYKNNLPQYERLAEMIYWGYTMDYGTGIPASEEAIRAACCTQQFAWEYINANIDGNTKVPSRESWNSNYMSVGYLAEWVAKAENLYNQYHGNTSFNNSKNKVDIGDTVIFSDANGKLQSYQSFNQNIQGINFSHTQGSNELIVSIPADCNSEKVTFNSREYGLYQLMPNGTPYNNSTMSNYIYIEFVSGRVQNLMFSNYVDPSAFSITVEVQSGKISITKEDSETGKNPQGDASFKNAQYQIYAKEDIYNRTNTRKFYSKGDLVATRFMNEQGNTEIVDKLPLGKYMIKEIASSEGYLIDAKEYDVNLEINNPDINIVEKSVTSKEVVKKMQVHVFKSGIKENSGSIPGLKGAEFTIKLNRNVEEAISRGFTYEEIWNGIDQNGNYVEVNEKRVKDAQKIAPTYAVLVTDENGNAYTDKNLPYGKYILKETKTPKDYETASDCYFSITQDESEVLNISQKSKHLIINNEQLEAFIKLIKKDLNTGKTVTLNSATFQIKATEDIYDRATKKILYKKDEIITQKVGSKIYDSFTTNSQNLIVANEDSFSNKYEELGSIMTPLKLPVGSYEIVEIKVPKGFLKLNEFVKFKVEGIRDFDKDADKDFIKEVNVCNEQPVGNLIVNKKIKLNDTVDTSIIDINNFSGIEFALIAKDEIKSPIDNETLYKKGQEVGKYKVNSDGNLLIKDLPMGKYELYETATLDGLVLNSEKYDIEFIQKDLETKVYEIKKEIENYPTILEFSKTDITGDKELEGAKLQVIDKDNNIVDEWVSGKSTHLIEGLNVGQTYTLKEEISPDGFVKATEIQFKVENTKDIQKITMIDKVLKIIKTDLVSGEEIEGAELKVIDENGTVIDEWISKKEPHIVNGLEENKRYTLIEKTAPYGYQLTEKIEFTVNKDKETQIIEMKDMPILKDIRIIKIDSKTNEIIKDKFSFGIYENAECTNLIEEIESNKEDGFVTFESLRYGTYFVKETEAPKGYILSNEILKIDINDNGVFINDNLIEEQEEFYNFEFKNEPIEIPNTGDIRNNSLLIAIAGTSSISLVVIGFYELKRRRNK